jgi:hypothetical protein
VDTAARQDTTDELARNSKQTRKQNLKPRWWLRSQSQRRRFNAAEPVARKTTTLPRTALISHYRRAPTLVPEGWNVVVGLGGFATASVIFALERSFCDILTTKKKKQRKENK